MRNNGNGNGQVMAKDERMARTLGWFSVGLGLAELLAPRGVGRLIGVGERTAMLRVLGLRELASGMGILSQRHPTSWVWSRVAGDVMDLALLGAAFGSSRSTPGRLGVATVAAAGVAALDLFYGRELSRPRKPGDGAGALHLKRVVTIDRPAEELYRFWRDFENLPRVLSHLRSVRVLDANRSHWVAKGPANASVEWEAELVSDTPGEVIAWRSLPGGDVNHAGSVRFGRAPGGRGTTVKVELQYRAPGGRLGSAVAGMFAQSPGKQIRVALLRFKQLMETGEIARTRGQPAGRRRSISLKYDALARA